MTFEEEFAEAERRHTRQLWGVCLSYEVSEGIVRPADEDELRVYFPLANPAMVQDFARIEPGSAASALAFVGQWGELGYRWLAVEVEAGPGRRAVLPAAGDPLLWLWAHARGVRTALQLYRLLQADDDDRLTEYLASINNKPARRAVLTANRALRESGGETDMLNELASLLFPRLRPSAPLDRQTTIVFGRGMEIGATTFARPTDPRGRASHALEEIISANLRDVRLEVKVDAGSAALLWTFTSLVGPLYRHLAELIEGDRPAECEECGLPFRRTHAARRYCPPPSWIAERPGGESACALRRRARNFRKRKNGGSS